MLGEPPRDEANGAIKPEELMVNVTGMAHLGTICCGNASQISAHQICSRSWF